MNLTRLLRYLLFSVFTFVIGVSFIWVSAWIRSPVDSDVSSDSRQTPLSAPPSPLAEQEPKVESSMSKRELEDFQAKFNFDSEVAALKLLPSFMGKSGFQTFYISKPQPSEPQHTDGSSVAYAYWKEDHSIIILNLPMSEPPTEQDLWWLSFNARVDLEKHIVARERLNMGCCLVTRAWANAILRDCKRGYKLTVNSSKRQQH
jgi:hypothetical protein